MNEQDLYAVLESFQNSIKMLEERLGQMDDMYHQQDERFHSLETMLFDDIINPAKQAMEDADKADRYDDFYSRNGERLDAFNEPLRSIERDDEFSLAKQAFDDYDALEEPKPEEGEYVDALVEKVESQINEIKSSLGLPADADVSVEQDGDTGEVEVKVDGQPVEEVSEQTEDAIGIDDEPAAEGANEEVAEEVATEEVPTEEDADADHDKELAALYEELEKSL